MTDNFNKYLKYKMKYLEIKNSDITGGGKNNKFILVDGTSSSGKSTICKYFTKKNFACFQIDNYWKDKRINYSNLFKKIKNNYGETAKIYNYEPVKYMINDAIKANKNILFDHISQDEIINYMNTKKHDLYIIVIFTNLDNLARNIESRRKSGDRRGIFVFNQFSERYVRCENDDDKKIEKINRKDFTNTLLKYFICFIFDNFNFAILILEHINAYF